jgi:hypothetical protein
MEFFLVAVAAALMALTLLVLGFAVVVSMLLREAVGQKAADAELDPAGPGVPDAVQEALLAPSRPYVELDELRGCPFCRSVRRWLLRVRSR